MGFDSKGNLYLSTGDNTDPCCEGYAPIDERPGREHQDAQGTSANTNDLRGKILRIHLEDDGTYTIPAGNLFAPGAERTRPEIWVMGLRNPYRLHVDKILESLAACCRRTNDSGHRIRAVRWFTPRSDRRATVRCRPRWPGPRGGRRR
jgi:hypothetical protein